MKKTVKDQQKTDSGPTAVRPVGRLVERVAIRVRKRLKAARTVNRAFVVVLKEEIKEALTEGFSVKDVWETLSEEGSVHFGYQAFRRHVNHLGLVAKATTSTPASTSDRAAIPAPQSAPAPAERRPLFPGTPSHSPAAPLQNQGMAGFTFNSEPKLEEIY